MQYLCIGYLFGAKPIQWPLMTLFTNADLCYDATFLFKPVLIEMPVVSFYFQFRSLLQVDYKVEETGNTIDSLDGSNSMIQSLTSS